MAGAGAGAIRAGRAYAELLIKDTAFFQGLQRAEDRLKAFGQRTSEIGRSMMTASAAVVTPAALSTKVFAGFDDQMRTVQAVTQGTDAQLQQLTETAKRLGASTSFKAEEVAGGMIELGRAGFKTDEIDKSIAHVMDLARATQTDIPTATNIAAAALRAFNMDASEMGRVCDVLTTAANGSATTLPELGEALKYAASTGALTGESLESTAKNLMAMANLGIRGSMAGTSMRAIQTRMATPDIALDYGKYGVSTRDEETGNLRALNEVLEDFQKNTSKLGNADRLAAFKHLFGLRGMTGGAAILSTDFAKIAEEMDKAAGAAARVAEQMDAGIGGAFRRFTSAVEAVAIKIGEALSPELQRLTAYITENTAKVGEWITQNKDTIVTVVKVAGEIGAAGAALVAFGTTISGVSAAIGGFSSVAAAVATAFGVIAGSPVAATLTAIGVAAAGAAIALSDFSDAEDEMQQHAAEFKADDAALKRLEELANKTEKSNEEMLEAAQIVDTLNNKYSELGLTIDPLTGKIEGLADAQAKMNAQQLRTAILDEQNKLKELKEQRTQFILDNGNGAKTEYTLEQIQDFDRRGLNMQTEGYAIDSVADEKRGSNVSRAVYNPATGKYQIAEQMAGVLGIGDETAEKARTRLERTILERNTLNDSITEQEKRIADLQALVGQKDVGYAALEAARNGEDKVTQAQQTVADATTQVAENIAEKAKEEAARLAETITPQEEVGTAQDVVQKSTKASKSAERWNQLITASETTASEMQKQNAILTEMRDAMKTQTDLL